MSKPLSAEEIRATFLDFTSRYEPLLASALLDQLYIHAKGEVYREIENPQQLDEFYDAMNELLVAVFTLCEKIEPTRP